MPQRYYPDGNGPFAVFRPDGERLIMPQPNSADRHRFHVVKYDGTRMAALGCGDYVAVRENYGERRGSYVVDGEIMHMPELSSKSRHRKKFLCEAYS